MNDDPAHLLQRARRLREIADMLDDQARKLLGDINSQTSLSNRTKNALQNAGYTALSEVEDMSGTQLKQIAGIGQNGKIEIETALEYYRQAIRGGP